MKNISVINNNNVITHNAQRADNFFARFKGLMFRKAIDNDYMLHITPCNQIHMLNMRFSIDVVYLSETGEIIKIDKNVQPGKICKTVKGAKSVLEMNSFSAEKYGISEGDIIKFTVRD